MFGIGQGLDLAGQTGNFPGDSGNLCIQCLNDRVGGSELCALLTALLLQFEQACLQFDGGVEIVFTFGAQVKGAIFVAELVEANFGFFKLLFELRQETTQKIKRFFSLSGLAFYILAHIVGAHRIQGAGYLLRVVALQRYGNHTRLLALL